MRNIYRSKKFETLINLFAKSTDDSGEKIFQTIKDFLCFAAILGYSEGRRKAFEPNESKDDIQEHIFSKDRNARPTVHAIAMAEKESVDILRRENIDEMCKIFEEYANGGLEIINQWLNDDPTDNEGISLLISGFKKHGYLRIGAEPKTPKEVKF